MQEPEVVDDSKETVFSKHSKADTHMNSGHMAAQERPAQVYIDKILALKRKVITKFQS